MDHELRSHLIKVFIPTFGIIMMLVAMKISEQRAGFSLKTDFGWQRPAARALFLWLGIWIGWMVLTEFSINALGMEQARKWHYPPVIVLLRIAAIGLLGPVAEEMLARGFFFGVARRKLTPVVTILLTSAVWAGCHLQYDWRTLTLIFLDGTLLGFARYRSGSLYVPIPMHVIANLFSIYQSLH